MFYIELMKMYSVPYHVIKFKNAPYYNLYAFICCIFVEFMKNFFCIQISTRADRISQLKIDLSYEYIHYDNEYFFSHT